MAEYEALSSALRTRAGVEFGTPVSMEEVASAEDQLGVRFPQSYRFFLIEFGWVSFGPFELYGLGTGIPDYLEVVTVTLSEREEAMPRLPERLVPLMNDGGGCLHCLDTSQMIEQECPVVLWDPDLGPTQILSEEAGGFVDWLLNKLGEAPRP